MDSDFYRIFNKLLKLKITNGFRISNGFRVQTDFGFRLLRILTEFGFSKVKRILFLETDFRILFLYMQISYPFPSVYANSSCINDSNYPLLTPSTTLLPS